MSKNHILEWNVRNILKHHNFCFENTLRVSKERIYKILWYIWGTLVDPESVNLDGFPISGKNQIGTKTQPKIKIKSALKPNQKNQSQNSPENEIFI